jgi:hypothetical protein
VDQTDFPMAVFYHDDMTWYNTGMKQKRTRSGRRGDPISLHPLTADQAVRAIFQIKTDDVKKIIASKPGRKK